VTQVFCHKAVTRGVVWVLKHPRNYLQFFLKLANFVYLFSKHFPVAVAQHLCMFTKQKSMQACTKTHHYEIKMQKFSGEGDTPSIDPTPSAPTAPRSSFAPTALKLNVTPPKKILVTALFCQNGYTYPQTFFTVG